MRLGVELKTRVKQAGGLKAHQEETVVSMLDGLSGIKDSATIASDLNERQLLDNSADPSNDRDWGAKLP